MQDCFQHARVDHKIACQRKQLIETRKEYIENVINKKVMYAERVLDGVHDVHRIFVGK